MRRILEGDIDRENGHIFVRHPKDKKPKIIILIPEDMDTLCSFPQGLPFVPFFRHERDWEGAKKGDAFGRAYLNHCWKRACKSLGIEGVTLYGGTRHSSVRALLEYYGPDEIKRYGTQHETNKAFERYMGPAERLRIMEMAEAAAGNRTGKELVKKNSGSGKAKLLKLK